MFLQSAENSKRFCYKAVIILGLEQKKAPGVLIFWGLKY